MLAHSQETQPGPGLVARTMLPTLGVGNLAQLEIIR